MYLYVSVGCYRTIADGTYLFDQFIYLCLLIAF